MDTEKEERDAYERVLAALGDRADAMRGFLERAEPSDLLRLFSDELQRDSLIAERISSLAETASDRGEAERAIATGAVIRAAAMLQALEEPSPYERDEYRASVTDALAVSEMAFGGYPELSPDIRNRIAVRMQTEAIERGISLGGEESYVLFSPTLQNSDLFYENARRLMDAYGERALSRPALLRSLWDLLEERGIDMGALKEAHKDTMGREFQSLSGIEKLSVWVFDRERYGHETRDEREKDHYESYHALPMRLFLLDKAASYASAAREDNKKKMAMAAEKIGDIPKTIATWEEIERLLREADTKTIDVNDPVMQEPEAILRAIYEMAERIGDEGWVDNPLEIPRISILRERISKMEDRDDIRDKIEVSLAFGGKGCWPSSLSNEDIGLLRKYGCRAIDESAPIKAKTDAFAKYGLCKKTDWISFDRTQDVFGSYFRYFHGNPQDLHSHSDRDGTMRIGLFEWADMLSSVIESNRAKGIRPDALSLISKSEDSFSLPRERSAFLDAPSETAFEMKSERLNMPIEELVKRLSEEPFFQKAIALALSADSSALQDTLKDRPYAAGTQGHREVSSGKTTVFPDDKGTPVAGLMGPWSIVPLPDRIYEALPSLIREYGAKSDPDGLGRYIELRERPKTAEESLLISLNMLHAFAGWPEPKDVLLRSSNPKLRAAEMQRHSGHSLGGREY